MCLERESGYRGNELKLRIFERERALPVIVQFNIPGRANCHVSRVTETWHMPGRADRHVSEQAADPIISL